MRIALTKRRAFRFWLALFPVFFVLWYFPFIDFPIRVAAWAVAFLILIGSVFFSWKFRVWRWVLIAVYGAVILFLVLPTHRPVDRSALRSDYCAALRSY